MKTLFPSFIFLCALSLLFSCKKEDVTTPVPVKEWHNVAPMPTPRYNFGLVECNGLLYAVGGYNTDGLHNVEAYDPSTNSWQPKAKMPTARGYLVVATVSNKIYAIGGISGSNLNDITYENVTEEYDPATNKWTKKAPFPAPYAYNSVMGNLFITGGAIKNKIYVGVGSSEGSMTLVYDPATDAWSQSAQEIPRFNFEPYFATTTGNELYVDNGDNFIKYISKGNYWIQLQPFSTTMKGACLAADAHNIYSIGGFDVKHEDDEYYISTYDSVRIYNIANASWTTTLPSLNYKRHSASAIVFNGNLYVAGGAIKQDNFSDVPLSFMERLSLK